MPTLGQLIERLRPAQARVDLDRLDANYRAVSAAAGVAIMPVVKADAYGHGSIGISRRFESLGVPLLAVAYPEEGALLRAAGIRTPIVVLSVFFRSQRHLLVEHDLTAVVSTPDTLDAALEAARETGRPLSVHLKVDTGMSRLGFSPNDVGAAASRLADSGRVVVEGFLTHLASADEDAAATTRQLDLFDAAIENLARRGIRPRWIHAGNSAAVSALRPTHTLVRPGLLLYGLRPRPQAPAVEVRPVMTFACRICLVKDIAPGTAVSYGGRWAAKRPSRLATVPIGYADGVPRTDLMSARGQFVVDGRRVPVAGRVCMDFTMLDVTDHPEVAFGHEAVLFGDDPTAWDVAEWSGTTVWQILTSVGDRVPRVYIEGGRIVDVDSRHL
jgi:alanine racemase